MTLSGIKDVILNCESRNLVYFLNKVNLSNSLLGNPLSVNLFSDRRLSARLSLKYLQSLPKIRSLKKPHHICVPNSEGNICVSGM